jgi:acetyl esterase/lipase
MRRFASILIDNLRMKKTQLLTFLFFSMCSIALAQTKVPKQEIILLWPKGVPTESGITTEEKKLTEGRIANVTIPTLTVYHPEHPNGTTVLIFPGGGYFIVSMGQEGCDWANWFNNSGITVAVLKYRMPNGHCKIPMEDAEQAMRILKINAGKWNINTKKIGVMGFSAGGHLASTIAVHYSKDTRPDFQILIYPVISMKNGITHEGSRKQLLGENPTQDEINYYSNELNVTHDTPPAFLMLTSDDPIVNQTNSINYYQELQRNNISVTMHIYTNGGHGFGNRQSFPYLKIFEDELSSWLNSICK